jgi:hypothetical protein
MDENTYWLRIWQVTALVVVALIATVGGCTAYESKRVADAVERGINPIDASCGIRGGANTSTICTLRSAK